MDAHEPDKEEAFSPFAAPATEIVSGEIEEVSFLAPAILIISLSIPTALLYTFSSISSILQITADTTIDDARRAGVLAGALFAFIILVGSQLVLLAGSLNLIKRYSSGFAWVTAIISLIPCMGSACVLGIPIGIWLIILLRKPGAVEGFTRS